MMSFLQSATSMIDPRITIHLNDIMFIMIVCFYAGRLYERRRHGRAGWPIQMGKYGLMYGEVEEVEDGGGDGAVAGVTGEQDYEDSGWDQGYIEGLADQQLHAVRTFSNPEQPVVQSNLQVAPDPHPLPSQQKLTKSLQLFDSQILPMTRHLNIVEKEPKQEQKQSQLEKQKDIVVPSGSNNQFLKQKIKLDGQKVQQKGKFQLFFQKSKDNMSFVRKIQKHQIITDYILRKQAINSHYGDLHLVPLKKQSSFPNDNSVIQVQYCQNYNGDQKQIPIMQKKIIELNQRSESYINSFIEHGKFRKLYRNIVKIGQGGFGIVYQAFNMLQSKKYAIKKIFIQKSYKEIQNLLGQIKILNSLSHPNIVKYNSCWLEYAEFNEHKEYQRILEGIKKRNKEGLTMNAISIRIIEDLKGEEQDEEQGNQNDEEYEQSYVSDSNSAFSFVRSGKQSTKKSIKIKRKQSIALKKDEQLLNPSLKTIQNNLALRPVMYIQMQLCEHSLAYYIKKRHQIDRVFAFEVMDQLIHGIAYIHLNRIVHRDLKYNLGYIYRPENILFATNRGSFTVKIGDFGLAVQLEEESDGHQGLMVPNTRAGTPSYIAPELYQSSVKKLSSQDLQKTDVYSLAVIYYEMLNKFSTSHQRGQKLLLLKQGKVAGLYQFKQQKKLIQELIRHNRPKARQILESQLWKKLAHTIEKMKKKLYRKKLINKKESASTNNTSNYSEIYERIEHQFEEHSSADSQPMKKSRTKSINGHKKSHKNAYIHEAKNQQDYQYQCTNLQPQDSSCINIDQAQHQQQQQQQIQLYSQNLQIIKRSTSKSSKNVITGNGKEHEENKIGGIEEQEQEEDVQGDTHPQLERDCDSDVYQE